MNDPLKFNKAKKLEMTKKKTLHLCLLAKMPPLSKEELATAGVAPEAATEAGARRCLVSL
jgi:hypothetical protein